MHFPAWALTLPLKVYVMGVAQATKNMKVFIIRWCIKENLTRGSKPRRVVGNLLTKWAAVRTDSPQNDRGNPALNNPVLLGSSTNNKLMNYTLCVIKTYFSKNFKQIMF